MNTSNNSITKKPNKIITLVIVSFAITAVATLLRLLSVLFFFEKDIAYYATEALLPVVSDFFCALAAIFFAVAATFLITENSRVSPPHTISRFAALLPGAAILFYSLMRAEELFNGDPHTIPSGYDIILFLASVAAMIFFFSILFCEQPTALPINAGVGMIAWIALSWMTSYSDFDVPMNSPLKLFFHFGCIGAALLVVSEMRAFFGIEKPKFYFFSLFGSILCLAISSIPAIVGYFCGKFEVYPFVQKDFVLFGLLIYATVRAIEILLYNRKICDDNPQEPEEVQDETQEVQDETQEIQDELQEAQDETEEAAPQQ